MAGGNESSGFEVIKEQEVKKVEATNIQENQVRQPEVGIKKLLPNTQEEIQSPFRRRKTLGSMKIDLNPSAVEEEDEED